MYHSNGIGLIASLNGISTTDKEPLVVKRYMVWAQDSTKLKELASNPTKTIPMLLANYNYDMNKVMVMLDNNIIGENDSEVLATLQIMKEKPICIHYLKSTLLLLIKMNPPLRFQSS